MIISTSSPDRSSNPVSVPAANQPAARSTAPRSDHLSTDSAALLYAALGRTPEIRPEIVARARAIASDPSYPPPAIIKLIAQQILAAPDLSEEQS